MKKTFTVVIAVILCSVWGQAQQADVAAMLGYPQMVVYNGKVVTMDDASFESRVGTIVQAMAIRDGKILATGSNREIRPLAGPQTESIDLKGRTVLPSFIMTHEHPTDWAFQEPRAITHVLPNDDVIIHRWMPSAPPEEQLAQFEPTIRAAVSKAKPGQWILLSFNYGPDYEWSKEMLPLFRKSITREWLDQLAPNNPLKVKSGFIFSVINQKAIDALRVVHPTLSVFTNGVENSTPAIDQWLRSGFSFNRPVEPDVMFQDKLPLLAEILKAEMELWASWGITTFGSSPYAYRNLHALDYLDRKGEMPGRFAWGYTGPNWDVDTLRYLAGIQGHGTDHLWLVGAWGRSGTNCMSVPVRPDWVETHGQEAADSLARCVLDPGREYRDRLELIIKSGLRIATMHSGGDRDIDYLMDAIEKASEEAGFTLEEIRAKRHAFDHGGGAPRPDQIPRMKRLGMITSQNNTYLWQPGSSASRIAEQYGIEYTSWVVPRKRLTEAGVMNTFEIDRPLPHKVFFLITKGMNRYHDTDRRVYGPDQRTDRIIQLKALTRWGAYYVLRENLLGTLEPGKLADFIVLDKDFLTIPEEQIPSIRVLMTSLGDKVVHLTSSFATETGMQPVGATTWNDKIPSGW